MQRDSIKQLHTERKKRERKKNKYKRSRHIELDNFCLINSFKYILLVFIIVLISQKNENNKQIFIK